MKHGICIECGKEKEIKAKGLCKACYEQQRLTRKAGAGSSAAKKIGEHLLVLDFTQHAGLLEEIRQLAEAEFRPLEWQVIHLLRNEMEGRVVV